MAKTKIKEYKFSDPVYRANISFLIGGSVAELIALIKERHGDAQMYSFDKKWDWTSDADTTDAYQFHVSDLHGKGEVFYLWVLEKDTYLFAHELYHLVGDILCNRGLEYVMESEEAFAYYFGYIFQEAFKLLKGRL
jgi:hypothetical protein